MLLKRASFDELVAAGAEYYPPSREAEAPRAIPLTPIADSPDDVVVLDDAILTAPVGIAWRGLWLADAVQFMGGNQQWKSADWLPGRYDADTDAIDLNPAQLDTGTAVDEPAMFIDSTVGGYNFGHFVHDLLPYGLLYRRVRDAVPTARPIVPRFKFAGQPPLFEAVFGIPYRDCIQAPADRPLMVKRLIVPRRQTNFDQSPWRLSFAGVRHIRESARQRWGDRPPSPTADRAVFGGVWLQRALSAMRSRLPTQEIAPTPDDASLKVLLHRVQDVDALRSRGELWGRDFCNIDEVPLMLLRNGFIAFEPGLAPFEHVVSTIHAAKMIVGIHGAGMANIIFARPGTRVIELTGFSGTWRDYEALSAVLDHEFIELRQPEPKPGAAPYIDLQQLGSLV